MPNYFAALPEKFIEDFIDDETEFRDYKFKMLEDNCIKKCLDIQDGNY